MRYFKILALLVLLVSTPVWASGDLARYFTLLTTNKIASSATVTMSGTTFTFHVHIGTGSAFSASSSRVIEWNSGTAANITINISSDTDIRFHGKGWSTTEGEWNCGSLATDAFYYFTVTYDAGATTNVPNVTLNGVTTACVEEAAPVGTWTNIGAEIVHIGSNAAGNRPMSGFLSHVAAWNVILTAGEIGELQTGTLPKPPCAIKRSNLLFYYPLASGSSPEGDVASSITGTVTGTVAFLGSVTKNPECSGRTMMGVGR